MQKSRNRSQNFRIELAYDGSSYAGWQIQPNGTTVQELLENALEKLASQRVIAHGSGRTDSGVHAERQVVSLQLPAISKTWTAGELHRALNAMLPHDVRVLRVQNAKPNFHARFSAKSKTYRYQIFCGEVMNPFLRRYVLHHRETLDESAMRRAARLFVGRKDFVTLSANPQRKIESSVRNVTRCSVTRKGDLILIRATADGFLYKMVRTMVGALIKVGEGRLSLDELRAYLSGGRRTALVETAPAHGLFLERVRY